MGNKDWFKKEVTMKETMTTTNLKLNQGIPSPILTLLTHSRSQMGASHQCNQKADGSMKTLIRQKNTEHSSYSHRFFYCLNVDAASVFVSSSHFSVSLAFVSSIRVDPL